MNKIYVYVIILVDSFKPLTLLNAGFFRETYNVSQIMLLLVI